MKDSSVSKRSNPNSVISSAAYLLFYRRRSAGPLGPPELQQVVNAWRNPDSETADDSDVGDHSRDVSPSGNGSRLGGSSHNGNGSSSAFGATAGAVALRGGGSGEVESLHQNEAAAGNREDDDPPPDYDEGYDDDMSQMNLVDVYAPLNHQPVWGFSKIPGNAKDRDEFEDDASDVAGFGDDDASTRLNLSDEDMLPPGSSTPLEEDDEIVRQVPPQLIVDDDLAEIRLKQE